MVRKNTPCAVMYAALKNFGVSNHEAALMLLDAKLTFDGKMLQERIDESSQLSRRIVHTAPGELPIGMFVNFHISCPQLYKRVVECQMAKGRFANQEEAAAHIAERLTGEYSDEMVAAMRACGVDPSIYINMGSYISYADLSCEERALLHLMMFTISGCLGNPRTASIFTVDYATDFLGADFHTAQTVISAAAMPEDVQADVLLGFVRVVDGRIKAGANMHVLDPEGTELGLLPKSKHVVADVGEDVSRRHAYVWREDGVWRIRDLCSTNGTWVLSGSTGEETRVESDRDASVEIFPTDIVRLGTTTSFMVLPVLGE